MGIWTDERDALLRELRLSGKTYKQIGLELGINRNSVASRLRRMGLSQKQVRLSPEEVRRRLLARREKHKLALREKRAAAGAKSRVLPSREKPEVAKLFDIALPSPPLNLDLLELKEDNCRFAYGDSAPYLFCGHTVVEGQSWCPAHFKICTTPPRPRNDSRPFPRAA